MEVTSFLIVCFMVSVVVINPALLPAGVLHQSYGMHYTVHTYGSCGMNHTVHTCGREMNGPQDLETGEACQPRNTRLEQRMILESVK